jgi:predicted ATPase
MKLRSAHIRHYKSLDDVQVTFSDGITVLVGPNAAGKSNIVDALRFVRDAVASDLDQAVTSRGGLARVRQASRTKPFELGIELGLVESIDGGAQDSCAYKFGIASIKASNILVTHESASEFQRIDHTESLHLSELRRARSGVAFVDGEKLFRVSPDQLALGRVTSEFGLAWRLSETFRDWRFSAIYPNRMREPSIVDKDSALLEDGRNWASVIKALRRSVLGRQALERIGDAMRVVFPTFRDVAVSTVGSYLVPAFSFARGSAGKVVFDPVQLSDGTLRIFGILLALYQTPAPSLLVIEEPEQTVHPGVLGVLADAFREAAETTQLIITTHSPNLIDYFAPEEVRVVSLEGGLTKVGHIKQSQVEAVKQRLMSMQEFMLAEGLAAEEA